MGRRNWLGASGGVLGGGGSVPTFTELDDSVFDGSLVDPNSSGLLTSLTYASATGWSLLYAGVTPASDASGATEFPGLEANLGDVLSDDFDWDTHMLQVRLEILALGQLGYRAGPAWGIEDTGGQGRGIAIVDYTAAADIRINRLTAASAQNNITLSATVTDAITSIQHHGDGDMSLVTSVRHGVGPTREMSDADSFISFDTVKANTKLRIGSIFRTGGTAQAIRTERFRIYLAEVRKPGLP